MSWLKFEKSKEMWRLANVSFLTEVYRSHLALRKKPDTIPCPRNPVTLLNLQRRRRRGSRKMTRTN